MASPCTFLYYPSQAARNFPQFMTSVVEPSATSPETKPAPPTPLEFLLKQPGAPTVARINELKQQVPGGRLRVFATSDGKRVYLLRGFSGLEMAEVQKAVPANSTRPEEDYVLRMAARCVVWTNSSPTGQLDPTVLQACGAGLPGTLFTMMSHLSDFVDPEMLDQLSGEI